MTIAGVRAIYREPDVIELHYERLTDLSALDDIHSTQVVYAVTGSASQFNLYGVAMSEADRTVANRALDRVWKELASSRTI